MGDCVSQVKPFNACLMFLHDARKFSEHHCVPQRPRYIFISIHNDLGGKPVSFFNTAKIRQTGAVLSLCLVFATACQTTNQGFDSTRDVDISETRIELPADLLALKGFKILKASISETGSYRSEKVTFTGGFFSYDRYMRGGIYTITKNSVQKIVDKHFSEFQMNGAIQKTNAAIGDVYSATLISKDETCILIMGNVGQEKMLVGGAGFPGQTTGQYCEKGNVPDLDKTVMKWLKRVRLRS